MNIVKFKDVMIEEDEFFNTKLRGKFCWCVNWKWIFALDDITSEEFIEKSKFDDPLQGSEQEYRLLTDYAEYVDQYATEKVNKVDAYMASNEFIPSDYTIDQLRGFRTLVAKNLLANEAFWDEEYNEDLTQKIEKMLDYYKNGMIDCAIKSLSEFSDSVSLNINGTYTDCGCGGTTSGATSVLKPNTGVYTAKSGCGCSSANSALLLQNTCDCVALYRTSLHNFMVEIFSDWKFWATVSDTVVPDMIEMLKAILNAGFPLSVKTTDVMFGDCSCIATENDEFGKQIISNLIKALTYIAENDVTSHKNFIKNSLYAWAANLYEIMEWQTV